MKRYIWCSPVKPGKTQQLIQGWSEELKRREEPNYKNEVQEFFDSIGLHNWNAWVQHTDEGDYFLNLIEVDHNWKELWEEFRTQLKEENPHAQLVQKLWFDLLGIDFGLKDPIVEPELIGEHQFGQLPKERIMCQQVLKKSWQDVTV